MRELNRTVILVFTLDLVSKLILGVVGLLLIRYMPQAEFALFTLATAAVTLVVQAMAASFNRVFIVGHSRFAATTSPSMFLATQLWLLVALALLAWPLRGPAEGLYGLATLLAFAMAFSEFARTFFQQQLRFLRFAAIELARSGLVAAGIVGLIAVAGFSMAAWHAMAVQAAAIWLVFAVAFGRNVRFPELFAIREAAGLLRRVLSGPYRFLFGYFAVLAAFTQMDILMLKALGDEFALATFGSAARYYALLSLALGAVHSVFLPAIQRMETARQLGTLFRTHARMFWAFIPFIAASAWLAGWVIPLVDAGKYPQAVDVFRILCVSATISFAFSPHVNLVLRYERFRFLFHLVIVGTLVNAAANGLLIPLYGARGAAVATLLASASITVPIFVLSRRLREAAGGGAGP
ncbi:MAG TPA: polysaccharide biosynthesis C-terminal domain-containing protein [Burkholderiales bacterium]|nr:polysaccharide biosynthesis C-terminal domain-containing protein [Burkholderiales bacterium]